MKRILAAAVACVAIEGCASDRPAEIAPAEARLPSEEEAGRILARARALRDGKGCAEAAPTFRVAAAMGEGLEIAQAELGACLLQMQGASATETALFRSEATFWLERAAYAGNAAAQKTLALELASDAARADDALKWALVYEKNGQAALYGYAPLPPNFVSSLTKQLPQDKAAAIRKEAETFSAVKMAAYVAPARARPEPHREQAPQRRP